MGGDAVDGAQASSRTGELRARPLSAGWKPALHLNALEGALHERRFQVCWLVVMIVALVLAGGESKRMDSPKALLKIGKETFAECIARKTRECEIPSLFFVTGKHHEEIKKALPGKEGINIIRNPHYEKGQLSSLKEGLRNLPTGTTQVLAWPVDLPLVKTETVRKLIDIFQQEKKHVGIPTYQSRKGHPVLYDLHAIQTLLSLSSSHTAKELQTTYAGQISFVDVEDPGILIDIDTPEDYQEHITNAGL